MSDDIVRQQPTTKLFFTVRLQDQHSDLLVREVERLREATRKTLTALPFEIDEAVVLPSAIHTIWTLPPDDADFGKRWKMLKPHFSRGLPAAQAKGSLDFKIEDWVRNSVRSR